MTQLVRIGMLPTFKRRPSGFAIWATAVIWGAVACGPFACVAPAQSPVRQQPVAPQPPADAAQQGAQSPKSTSTAAEKATSTAAEKATSTAAEKATSTVAEKAAAASERDAQRPRPQEQARRTYLDRIVAAPMSHLGASWLVRPERQAEENVEKALSHLGLTAGMTVCDLGAGNGYWTLPLAKAVSDDGQVFAVDIQPEMLRQLRTRAGKASLKNIKTVLGAVDDPNLPKDVALDLLLMVDVYHEFSHPESMLWAIRQSLAPEGVIALLEYREEDPEVPIKPLHKMSKRQIMREYTANGFKLVREYNDLPWQHLMFFARDDSPLAAIEPQPFEAD